LVTTMRAPHGRGTPGIVLPADFETVVDR
jgi:hypothetical protein